MFPKRPQVSYKRPKGNELNEVSGPVNKQGNTGGASADKLTAARQVFF